MYKKLGLERQRNCPEICFAKSYIELALYLEEEQLASFIVKALSITETLFFWLQDRLGEGDEGQ